MVGYQKITGKYKSYIQDIDFRVQNCSELSLVILHNESRQHRPEQRRRGREKEAKREGVEEIFFKLPGPPPTPTPPP